MDHDKIEHLRDAKVGYLLLEDCVILVQSKWKDANYCLPLNEPLDVEMPSIPSTTSSKNEEDFTPCSEFDTQNMHGPICYHCNLVVTTGKISNNTLERPRFAVEKGTLFDGTIEDTCPDPTRCDCDGTKRLDAALLVGLALNAVSMNHIRITIMFS